MITYCREAIPLPRAGTTALERKGKRNTMRKEHRCSQHALRNYGSQTTVGDREIGNVCGRDHDPFAHDPDHDHGV